MIKLFLLFVFSLSLSNICLASTSPKPWDNPTISFEIFSKVLYYPISHSSVAEIAIKELDEPLIDLLKINNPRLIPLSSFNDKYNNTYEGWSKVRLGVYQRLLKMLNLLPDNVGIAYFEGFRTLSKQKEYFDKKFLEILQTIPDKYQAYSETTKHVSPFINNIPTHATGAAIDMTLFTVINGGKKYLLDMGQFDVIFGPNDQQETFSKNTTITQRKNRLILLRTAIKAGFANYGFEWWHYSYGDKMHALVYGKPKAIYGLATEKNNPILFTTKDEYIKEIVE